MIKKLLPCLPLLVLLACGYQKDKAVVIDYFGQQSPGLTAKEFAPGIVSTDSFEHSSPVFSPDGSVVLWNQINRGRAPYILESTFENGAWSAPHIPSFGDSLRDDFYPQFSTDGKTLYFSSRRKVPEGYKQNDMYIWKVERNNNSWGTPVIFDTTVSKGKEYAHAITNSGAIYFSESSRGPTGWSIRRSRSDNGKYTGTQTLPFGINALMYEDGAYIAPDESYLIYESHRSEGINGSIDLYISFHLEGDRWSLPVNMGPRVNTSETERMPKVSPDGKYLFFGSNRDAHEGSWGFDIFWIEASVIDELRNHPFAKIAIEQPLGDDLLKALESNDAEKSAALLKEWNSKYPDHMEGTRTLIVVLRKEKKFEEAEKVIAAMPQEWMQGTMFKIDVALTKYGSGKNEEAAAIIEPILVPSNELELRYWQMINGLTDIGLYDLADNYFERLSAGGIHPVHVYNRACFYAQHDESDRAFKHLNIAIDKGYAGRSQYEQDTDLSSLKSDPRWNKLVKRLK